MWKEFKIVKGLPVKCRENGHVVLPFPDNVSTSQRLERKKGQERVSETVI